MIQLTLLDGRKHLFHPDLIQETGTYTWNKYGSEAVDAASEERNFVLMTGGCDPLDIVETADQVAILRACWYARGNLSPHPVSAYVLVDADGEISYMGVNA